ncbi:ParB/RepB/Spo0J family partition protein [Achromobacter mucicolens]|uniref:ParB/RepB/Spo0J family partition protein n=1 Tax=Achromobacter mucicolens TaxID=1389922 RepID=UPI0024490868|nr:ParB/RepB/Spo0J family partition protein [Achromobacter mucicolens]MDH1522187.1 ParB/RepB/Spo0J family partition protein [Achromobacter mucicolens]
MALGVREPILVWKDPETGQVIVVDGRQRVRHAIEANRRLAERGEPTIFVPGVAQRGTLATMSDLMIAMNEARRDDPPLTKARKMAAFVGRGYSESRLAIIFACSPLTVRNTLALLNCTKAVQDAADSGQITLTHAKALAKLTPDEQRAKVTRLVEAGKDATPHQRSRQQAAVMGERPRMKSRKQILTALDQAQGEYAAALRWVLGT